MERLTAKNKHGKPIIKDWPNYMEFDIINRLAAIEDILGDEYELEEIRKVIRCKDCEHMWAVSALPGECYCRLRGEVVPRDGYCHRGKAALKAREQDE